MYIYVCICIYVYVYIYIYINNMYVYYIYNIYIYISDRMDPAIPFEGVFLSVVATCRSVYSSRAHGFMGIDQTER